MTTRAGKGKEWDTMCCENKRDTKKKKTFFPIVERVGNNNKGGKTVMTTKMKMEKLMGKAVSRCD
jgi:hypothetical protein